jgi:LacI family transcriptional regulator
MALMKSVSIKDIAKKAGVAPSTVSSVLNGKAKQARISDKVSEAVKLLAKEMGYQPNHTAVSLRTGKTHILGLIVEDISNAFFAKLAKTIEDEAYKLGYKIVYCSTENDGEKGCELIRMLLYRQVDGFLITPSRGMEQEIDKLIAFGKPVVLMDRYFPGQQVPATLVDNYNGVKQGIEHLIEKGYKKIAFVTVDLDQVQMLERTRSYQETLKLHGFTPDENGLLQLPYTSKPEMAVEAISAFISANPSFDAVFFATNYLGIYGLESIKKLGLSIPGHLAVVCFDDHDIFRLFTPGITIVEQPVASIAQTAMQLLMEQFKHTIQEEGPILKHTRLIIREST